LFLRRTPSVVEQIVMKAMKLIARGTRGDKAGEFLEFGGGELRDGRLRLGKSFRKKIDASCLRSSRPFPEKSPFKQNDVAHFASGM